MEDAARTAPRLIVVDDDALSGTQLAKLATTVFEGWRVAFFQPTTPESRPPNEADLPAPIEHLSHFWNDADDSLEACTSAATALEQVARQANGVAILFDLQLHPHHVGRFLSFPSESPFLRTFVTLLEECSSVICFYTSQDVNQVRWQEGCGDHYWNRIHLGIGITAGTTTDDQIKERILQPTLTAWQKAFPGAAEKPPTAAEAIADIERSIEALAQIQHDLFDQTTPEFLQTTGELLRFSDDKQLTSFLAQPGVRDGLKSIGGCVPMGGTVAQNECRPLNQYGGWLLALAYCRRRYPLESWSNYFSLTTSPHPDPIALMAHQDAERRRTTLGLYLQMLGYLFEHKTDGKIALKRAVVGSKSLQFTLRFPLCDGQRQPNKGSLMDNVLALMRSALDGSTPSEKHMTANALWQFFLHSSVSDRGDVVGTEGVFGNHVRMNVRADKDSGGLHVEWQRR
jgi:CheY-like chemotaxis protein